MAPLKIGQILISEGHLTQEGLEEAIDWQVLYGGRLGTNLLELRLVEDYHRQDLAPQRPHDEDEDDRETPVERHVDSRDATYPHSCTH